MGLWPAVCRIVVAVETGGSGMDLAQRVRCWCHPCPYPYHPCRDPAKDRGPGLGIDPKDDQIEELVGDCGAGSVAAAAAFGRQYQRLHCERWQADVPWNYPRLAP